MKTSAIMNISSYKASHFLAAEHLVIFKYFDGISEIIGVLFAIKIIAPNAEYSDTEYNEYRVMQRI